MPTMPLKLSQYQSIIEKTLTSFIQIKTHPKEELSLTDSKLGGIPYWPQSKPLILINNKLPKLVAQINLSQLSEQELSLPHFPNKGLLQFFFASGVEVCSGFDHENLISNDIAVIYHENMNEEQLENSDLIKCSLEQMKMPFSKTCELIFSVQKEYLGMQDFYHNEKYYRNINFDDETSEIFYDEISNSGSKLGGYAYFTQEDPRAYGNFSQEDEWILLFQLDSDDNLMWSDVGVGNWFIRKKDLIALNFEHVFFTWDCC